jgi:hypothetical protein
LEKIFSVTVLTIEDNDSDATPDESVERFEIVLHCEFLENAEPARMR